MRIDKWEAKKDQREVMKKKDSNYFLGKWQAYPHHNVLLSSSLSDYNCFYFQPDSQEIPRDGPKNGIRYGQGLPYCNTRLPICGQPSQKGLWQNIICKTKIHKIEPSCNSYSIIVCTALYYIQYISCILIFTCIVLNALNSMGDVIKTSILVFLP